MKGKAIREPSQTYTHTHTHGCTHVYTHAQLRHINIVAQVIWVLCCFCFTLCLFALSSHSISCSSSSICFLFFSQPLCLIFSQHTPTQLHTYLPSAVLLVSVNYNEKNSYSISKRSVIIKKPKKVNLIPCSRTVSKVSQAVKGCNSLKHPPFTGVCAVQQHITEKQCFAVVTLSSTVLHADTRTSAQTCSLRHSFVFNSQLLSSRCGGIAQNLHDSTRALVYFSSLTRGCVSIQLSSVLTSASFDNPS